MKIKIAILAFVALIATLSGLGTPAEAGPFNPADRWVQFEACETDEAEVWVAPCVWDARHQGNGIGKSFRTRQDGTVKFIKHHRAHRLQEGFEVPIWEACFWNGVHWNVPCVHDSLHPLSTGGGDLPHHLFHDGSFKMGDFDGDGYVTIKSLTHRRAHYLLGL